MEEGSEKFSRRQQSFRIAMQQSNNQNVVPQHKTVTSSEKYSDNFSEDKQDHVLDMHSFQPSILEIRKCVTRNHSSESTSSDVSLLSTSSSSVPVSSKFLWSIIVAIFLLSAGTFAYMLFKLNAMQGRLKSIEDHTHDSSICVPCANITLGPFEEDNEELQRLQKKTTDGTEMCCATNANQTLILANLIIEHNRQIHRAQELLSMENRQVKNKTMPTMTDYNPREVAAHLLVGAQEPPQEDSSEKLYHIKNLQSSSPVAVSSGLQITSDRITVNESGLYFVYSQIYFSKMYSDKITENSMSFYHYVYRYNVIYPNGGKQMLLKSVRAQCWARDKLFTDYSSYTAGVFNLAASDSLYVLVSDISAVSRDPKKLQECKNHKVAKRLRRNL